MDVIRQSVDESEEKIYLKEEQQVTVEEEGTGGKARSRGGRTIVRRNQARSQIATIDPTPLQYELDQEFQISEENDSSNKTVAYRVVQLTDDLLTTVPYTDASSPLHGGATTTTVYTNQLNTGGVCLLSSGHPIEVYPVSPEAIVPRIQDSTTNKTVPSVYHQKRDDKRRATHNEVERRRRDKINNWIMKLSKIIPDCKNESSKGPFESQSKGCILAKACDFITELKDINKRLMISIKQHEELMREMDAMTKKVEDVTQENELLKATLAQHGLPLP